MRPEYTPLSSYVVKAFEKTARLPPNLTMREAAAKVAEATWGRALVEELTVLLNVAGLAVAAGDRVKLYTVGQSVIDAVTHELTTMGTVDAEPSMFAEPWILEPYGYDRGVTLWGEAWGIGGYRFEDTAFLVGVEGGSARAEPWFPEWPGDPRDMVNDTVMVVGAPADKVIRWARESLRWAVCFGRMMDAGVFRSRAKDHPIAAGRVITHTAFEMPGAKPSTWATSPAPPPRAKASSPGAAGGMNREARRRAKRR